MCAIQVGKVKELRAVASDMKVMPSIGSIRRFHWLELTVVIHLGKCWNRAHKVFFIFHFMVFKYI